MRILKFLAGLILLIVLVIVVGAIFLPREVAVARTTTIEAPASDIFPYINSMQENGKWSPWLERDPNVQLTYSGPAEGVGNRLDWKSDHPQVGNGTQIVTASEPGKRVVTSLDFGEMGTAEAEFLLAETKDGTDVTWEFATDMGSNPISRWMGLLMDGWVGGDYEVGLAKLKALVEG